MDDNTYTYTDPDNVGTRFIVSSKASTLDGQHGSGDDKIDLSQGSWASAPQQWFDDDLIREGDQGMVTSPITGRTHPVTFLEGHDPGDAGFNLTNDVWNNLGQNPDSHVHVDLSNSVLRPPQYDLTTPEGARAALAQVSQGGEGDYYQRNAATNAASAGTMSTDSVAPTAMPKKYQDGTVELPNGQIVYPDGTVQAYHGNTMTQWSRGQPTPKVYNLSPRTVSDKATQLTYQWDYRNQKWNPIGFKGDPASVDLDSIQPGDLNSVPSEFRNIVGMMSRYGMPISAFAIKSPYILSMLNMASRVNPDLDMKNYQALQKTMNSFTPDGKSGADIKSFNNAMIHLGQALNASDEMKQQELNVHSQPINWAQQKYYTVAGEPEGNPVMKYMNAKAFLDPELARSASGAAPHTAEQNVWNSQLSPTLTYGLQKTALASAAESLAARIKTAAFTYEQQFGKPPPFSLLSPGAEDTLKKVGLNDMVDKYGSQGGKKPYIDQYMSIGNTGTTSAPSTSPSANQPVLPPGMHRTLRNPAVPGIKKVQDTQGNWNFQRDDGQ